MKHSNELDDFLKEKEGEFNIPFEEKHWEKASAYLESERRTTVLGNLTKGNLVLVAALLIGFIGAGSYFIFNNNSKGTATTIATTTVTNSNNSSNSNTTVNSSETTSTLNNINSINSSSAKNNTSVSNSNATASAANKADVKANSNNPSSANTNAVAANTSKKGSKLGRADKKTAASIASSSARAAKPLSGTTTKGSISNKNSTANTTAAATDNANNGEVNTSKELTAIDNDKPLYMEYHLEPVIPFPSKSWVEVQAEIYKHMPFLKSESGGAAKKIREFKYGAAYPQLNVSLSGGVNIFNHLNKNSDKDPLVSTNPYLGIRAAYQWRPEMFIQAQLNFLQRGAVNVNLTPIDNVSGSEPLVKSIRHLYYAQLPVSFGYQFTKKNCVTAGLGVNYLIGEGTQEKTADTTARNVGSYKFENTNSFNKVDVFVTAGYCYRLNKNFSFAVNANYGLMNVFKNVPGNAHNMNLGLGINYTILQKKVAIR